MADWLLVVPRSPATPPTPDLLPNPAALAAALRAPGTGAMKRTDVPGAVFFTVAETADDPGVATVAGRSARKCAMAASALLTERDDLVRALRSAGRAVDLATSDGALLAHAAEVWGEDAWARPGGEFALAAWLDAERTLLLATDGEGARPVLWAETERGIVASTRFEAMMVAPYVSREPDPVALLDYLSLRIPTPVPTTTWLAQVEELPPGHSLRWSDGVSSRHQWWSFPSQLSIWQPRDAREATERFRLTLRRSLRERLRGHRRVVVALTGGMDSPPVAAEAVALRDGEGMDLDINAVHAVYPAELNSPEADLAASAAAALRIPFTGVPIGDVPLWPLQGGICTWPPNSWFGSWVPLAAAVAEHGAVALVGASGEIFSRASYLDALERGRWLRIPATAWALRRLGLPFQPWNRSLWKRSASPLAGLIHREPPWIRPAAAAAQGAQNLRDELLAWKPEPRRLAAIQALIALTRRSSHQFDRGPARVAMLNPFADRRVVRLAASIEPVPWRMAKYVVRRSYEGILPPAVLSRPRAATPWFGGSFFRSGAATTAASVPLHPLLEQLIDGAEWRGQADLINGWTDGAAWLRVLAVSAWLYQIDG